MTESKNAQNTSTSESQSHTPGPWRLDSYNVWSSAGLIANCYSGNNDLTVNQAKANARLMAAAPEMKEELQGIRETIKSSLNFGTGPSLRVSKIIVKSIDNLLHSLSD